MTRVPQLFYVVVFALACTVVSAADDNRFTTRINFRKCKLTHTGIEYQGNVFTTQSKSLCRTWDSIGTEPDENFADGSRMSAKNYCRNPNGTRDDLWCYTYGPDNPVEPCAVPLCNAKRCRVTGPGVEYGGDANVTRSGYGCMPWSAATADDSADSRFPDPGGRVAAGNRCRNPTGDPGGPWCYASVDGAVVPDYCDTFGCDDDDDDGGGGCGWTLINGGGTRHGHYTAMDGGGESMAFDLKVWDPAAAVRAVAPFRMSLTAYPIGGEFGGGGGGGFEVSVPTAAFARSARDAVRMELTWRNGFAALSVAGRELLSYELNTILANVSYASFVAGDGSSPVAVRFPHCDGGRPPAVCEEHVTNGPDAHRIFPLRRMLASSSELSLSVRAMVSASVVYYTAPVKQTPRLTIVFAARPAQQIKILYKEQPASDEQLIFNQTYDIDIVSYWKWHQYMITAVDKTLQILVTNKHQPKDSTVLLSISDFKLRFFHWFAIGSETIAHWTLYCSGPEYYPLPEALLPECLISESGESYRGTQWVTGDGIPCMPWNASATRKGVVDGDLHESAKDKGPIDGIHAQDKNYCRNPTGDPEGPYCFVAVAGNAVEKRSCHVRKCRNTMCCVTGIGSDYLGTLNTTLSNRTCLKWSATIGARGHFPDGSAKRASNYCRNPTGHPTGPWCYVNGAARTDLCDVPDCSVGGGHTTADTVLLVGGGVQWSYALPEWRNAPGLRVAVKRWSAGGRRSDASVSLHFRRARDPSVHDQLQLTGERIAVYRVRDGGGPAVAVPAAQLVYPHLVMASRWTELLFEFADDEVTMRSAADGQTIFRWNATADGGGRVVSVGVSAAGDDSAGVRIPAQECLVYSSESKNFTAYLPLNVRTNKSLGNVKNEITFRMRHTGVTRIALIKRTLNDRYVLEIGDNRAELLREGERPTKSLGTYDSDTGDIVAAYNWTRILLSWNESVLRLDSSDVDDDRSRPATFRWDVDGGGPPLLVRHFSVANRNGRTVWTVNCDERWRRPPDLDGPPRDGGWSEWGEWERCTKACGGGTGVRRRRCDSPTPNMSGRPCVGPDTATGPCNRHECGDVSAGTAAAVRRQLVAGSNNVAATAGDRLSVSCNRTTANAVKADAPRATFTWLHNGKPVPFDAGGCTLNLGACTAHNSGLYAFVAQPPESERIVLNIIAVSVYDKPISVYIGDKIPVWCNAVTLGYIFNGGLSQKWVVNDSFVIKSYGLSYLTSIDADTITIENEHFQGIWKCVTGNNEVNSTWVTNVMEVKVLGVPTTWTRIMQDPIIKTIFRNIKSPTVIIWISASFIFSICVFGFAFAYFIDRARVNLTKRKSKSKQKLKKISYKRL